MKNLPFTYKIYKLSEVTNMYFKWLCGFQASVLSNFGQLKSWELVETVSTVNLSTRQLYEAVCN